MTGTGSVAVDRLLAAIEGRDPRAVGAAVTEGVTWQNVPHQAAHGRSAVVGMLAPILAMSDRVRWEILTAAADGDGRRVVLERLDHFWIDGNRYTAPCNGVFEVEGDRVAAVRDYVDLGRWRGDIGPVLAAWAERSPVTVVERHLAAVQARDPIAMAADYGPDATLVRRGDVYRGYDEIRGYFDSVPGRLGPQPLALDRPRTGADGDVVVSWRLGGAGGPAAAGTDRYRVSAGWIVEQTVELAGSDF